MSSATPACRPITVISAASARATICRITFAIDRGQLEAAEALFDAEADQPRLAQLLVAVAHVRGLHDDAVLEHRGIAPAGARLGLDRRADLRAGLEHARAARARSAATSAPSPLRSRIQYSSQSISRFEVEGDPS